MKKILSAIVTKVWPSKPKVKSSAKTIYEQDIFHKLIEMERDRVHRNDRQFSLLLIHLNGNHNVKPRITELIEKVSNRLRKTDRLGWYDDNHLGVLLPYTPCTGAQVFANEIRKCQNINETAITFETLSYPDK